MDLKAAFVAGLCVSGVCLTGCTSHQATAGAARPKTHAADISTTIRPAKHPLKRPTHVTTIRLLTYGQLSKLQPSLTGNARVPSGTLVKLARTVYTPPIRGVADEGFGPAGAPRTCRIRWIENVSNDLTGAAMDSGESCVHHQ
jgi:hypothetical protein